LIYSGIEGIDRFFELQTDVFPAIKPTRLVDKDAGCIFRLKADSDSGSIRTPVPVQSGHRFRLIPATFSRCPESDAAHTSIPSGWRIILMPMWATPRTRPESGNLYARLTPRRPAGSGSRNTRRSGRSTTGLRLTCRPWLSQARSMRILMSRWLGKMRR
jgi:hypothetical protein